MSGLSRRRLTALLFGAGSLSLSGCTFAQDNGSDDDEIDPSDDNGDENEVDEPRPSDDDVDDGNGDEPEPVDLNPQAAARATIDWGEPIGSPDEWVGIAGANVTVMDDAGFDDPAPIQVDLPSSTFATAQYQFPEPFDLTDRHVSTAVKVDTPTGGSLEIRLRAPTSDDRLVCRRRLPSQMDEWMRVDLGITQAAGSPDFENVSELRLHVAGDEHVDVKYWINDVRVTESSGDSFAILAFYGARDIHYDTVFPILEERGLAAAVPIAPRHIDVAGRMSIDELRELRDAGWDICSWPIQRGALPDLRDREQRRVIENTHEHLIERGFEDGARHFFAPQQRIDGTTIEIIRDIHETGFVYGGNSAGMPPTAPHTLPVINGGDYDGSRSVILRADVHDQLVTLVFDRIGPDGMSVRDFENQLDRLQSNEYGGGLNIITPSELVDEYLQHASRT